MSALQRFGIAYEEELAMLYHLASRFARLHLSSPAQRAAYLVLVCDRAKAWSAADVAQLKGVEKTAVERALDGFVSAGIAEKSQANPARYRWITDMENLFDDGADDRVDPVCGMSTAADSPYTVTDAAGAVVWFCSKPCQTAFIDAPDEFAHSPTRVPATFAAATSGSRDRPKSSVAVNEHPPPRQLPAQSHRAQTRQPLPAPRQAIGS